jgi:hypothetical protein
MIADTLKQTQAALIAQVEYEEAYDTAKFALEQALPSANQEVIIELLGSLIDVLLCSLKNQMVIAELGDENDTSH